MKVSVSYLLLLVPLLATMGSAATIYNWFCSNSMCADGSCHMRSETIEEDACVLSPQGTMQSVVFKVHHRAAGNQSCVNSINYGQYSIIGNDLSRATGSQQTVPCDFCMQSGPDNLPMKVTGCNGTSEVDFHYHCNSDCSKCNDMKTIGRHPVDVVDQVVALTGTSVCPDIIETIIYQSNSYTPNCSTGIAYRMYQAAGLGHCNGYSYNSNAKANLYVVKRS
jgi:hypothetical protein